MKKRLSPIKMIIAKKKSLVFTGTLTAFFFFTLFASASTGAGIGAGIGAELDKWAEGAQKRASERIEALDKRELSAIDTLKKSDAVREFAGQFKDEKAVAVAERAVAVTRRTVERIRRERERVQKLQGSIEETRLLGLHSALATYIIGEVEIKRPSDRWAGFDPDQRLRPGDRIRTEENSFLEMIVTDGSIMRLGGGASIRILKLNERESVYGEITGPIHVTIGEKAGKLDRSYMLSPAVCACVGVTVSDQDTVEFIIESLEAGASSITVLNGKMIIKDGKEQYITDAGEMIAVMEDGKIDGTFIVETPFMIRWWEVER